MHPGLGLPRGILNLDSEIIEIVKIDSYARFEGPQYNYLVSLRFWHEVQGGRERGGKGGKGSPGQSPRVWRVLLSSVLKCHPEW